MDETVFSFDLIDKYTPEKIIWEKIKDIKKATKEYVEAEIKPYDGPLYSYYTTKKTGILAGIDVLAPQEKRVRVDIQEKMGNLSDEEHKYEVIIRAPKMKSYEYRMMLIGYEATAYPATVVLSEEIADEYAGKQQDTFIINSMNEMETMIKTLMTSQVLISLIQSLIFECKRRELEDSQNHNGKS